MKLCGRSTKIAPPKRALELKSTMARNDERTCKFKKAGGNYNFEVYFNFWEKYCMSFEFINSVQARMMIDM
jgi:hypothetical protein